MNTSRCFFHDELRNGNRTTLLMAAICISIERSLSTKVEIYTKQTSLSRLRDLVGSAFFPEVTLSVIKFDFMDYTLHLQHKGVIRVDLDDQSKFSSAAGTN